MIKKLIAIILLVVFSIAVIPPAVYADDSNKIQLEIGIGNKKEINTKKGALAIVSEYVGAIYIFGAGLAAIVAVIMIIVGGFEIMASSGSGDISQGKDRIMQALLGVILIALSAVILNFVNPNFFKFS